MPEEDRIERQIRRSTATYSNGGGERRQADTDDLNVPLALTCQVIGRERWLEGVG
jgi:hypothetical protein